MTVDTDQPGAVVATLVGPARLGLAIPSTMPDDPWRVPTLTPEGEAFIRATHRRGPGGAKLTEASVREILRRLAAGTASRRALAGEYGVSTSAIDKIAAGRTWGQVERPEPRR